MLAEGYIRDAEAAVVVYDITKSRALEKAKDWIEIAQNELGDSSFIVLVGNKIDLDEERKVTTEAGRQLADEMKARLFVETSAKTGHNVEPLFKELAITVPGPGGQHQGLMELPRNLSRDEDAEPPARCK